MMADERFEEGIRLFNDGEFFDAHEVWEDLWHDYRLDDRSFLQSLIQLAAGFYHAQCNNEKGARSQLSKGLEKLGGYLPAHQSIRSGMLVTDVEKWLGSYDEVKPEAHEAGRYPHIERNIP